MLCQVTIHWPLPCRCNSVRCAQLRADDKYSVLVSTRDRFGNWLDYGGATVAVKLQYIKQGMHDSNSLTAHNSTASIEDKGDGTYLTTFAVSARGLANYPLNINVVINFDKDPKEHPNGIDLPPIPCWFHLPPDQRTENRRSSSGGLQRGMSTMNLQADQSEPPGQLWRSAKAAVLQASRGAP